MTKAPNASNVYPYREAVLIIPENIQQKWYIKFYVWNIDTKKLERMRDYSINKYKDLAHRAKEAENIISIINGRLKEGGYYVTNASLNESPKRTKREAASEPTTQPGLTVREAFALVLKIKDAENRKSTFEKYQQIHRHFLKYAVKFPKLLDSPITDFDRKKAQGFYEYILLEVEGIQIQTKKDIQTVFKGFFTTLIKLERITVNPCPQVKRMKKRSKKNKAFDKEQLSLVVENAKNIDYALYEFLMTMFYTFARPRELRAVKIFNIDMAREKIIIPANISKNNLERQIDISPHLMPILEAKELKKYPGDYFLFGKKGVPSNVPCPKNHFYVKIKRAFKSLKIDDPDLTLYSMKHSGISYHYLAGVDIEALRDQSGHEDMESFMIYLKSLNLIENKRFKDKSPAI